MSNTAIAQQIVTKYKFTN